MIAGLVPAGVNAFVEEKPLIVAEKPISFERVTSLPGYFLRDIT